MLFNYASDEVDARPCSVIDVPNSRARTTDSNQTNELRKCY